MKFSINDKINGEFAIRRMNEKARWFYSGTDPLDVYEYDGENGKLYAVRFCGELKTGYTFDSLEEWLTDWAEDFADDDEEED